MIGLYRLDDKNNAVMCKDYNEYNDANKKRESRHVADEIIEVDSKKYRVSTVFLGIDHQYEAGGPPLVFETMVSPLFNGDVQYSDLYCRRYSSWAEADQGHKETVQEVITGVLNLLRTEED